MKSHRFHFVDGDYTEADGDWDNDDLSYAFRQGIGWIDLNLRGTDRPVLINLHHVTMIESLEDDDDA